MWKSFCFHLCIPTHCYDNKTKIAWIYTHLLFFLTNSLTRFRKVNTVYNLHFFPIKFTTNTPFIPIL